jgi:hypothetical protein
MVEGGITLPLNADLLSPRASGAVKAGVPAVFDKKASEPLNSLQTPKSAIWTRSDSLRSKFAGLISR